MLSPSNQVRTQTVPMRLSKQVSDTAMHAEWQEIQAAQQNPACFKPLYDRYFERIFRFIYRRTTDEDLTADLCSRVFLKALQQLKKYRFKGVPFSSWLFRIATNEVAQYFRNTQKQRVISLDAKQLGYMASEMDTAYDETRRIAMLAALDELSEADVALIEMRFFEQRPFREIANILAITENNAKVRTYRILAKLKKYIIKKQDSSEV